MGVARTDNERRRVLRSIARIWNGHEVWRLAGGGTLAFPKLYAASFSGGGARRPDHLYASASSYGLKVGLAWFIPGMILATAYFWYVYRSFGGKVTVEETGY